MKIDDIKSVVAVVQHEKLWEIHRGRKHLMFKTLPSDPLSKLDRKKLNEYMKKKITDYKRYKQFEEAEDLSLIRH